MRYCRGAGTTLAFALVVAVGFCSLTAAVSNAEGEAASVEIIEVVASFQQATMVNLDVAGAIWMSDTAYNAWHDAVGGLSNDTVGSCLWFADAFQLTGSAAVPCGGLYSPWLGTLLVLDLDEGAATVTGFSLQLVAEPLTGAKDPMALAESLMDSIRQGASAFDQAAGTPSSTDVERSLRSAVATRVDKYVKALRSAYVEDSPAGKAATAVLERLADGQFPGPLSLLRSEDERWIATLVPVWLSSTADRTVVVLGSWYAPLTVVWLEFDDIASGDVTSVSLIRLFDRVITRGGGDT